MISKDRQYRSFEVRASENDSMIVEGYAVVFNQSTVMYEYDGIQYKEVVDRNALAVTEMKDVVLNYNHVGKPFGRTKNNTLMLSIDDYGLKVKADLSGTEEGRKTYEEVKGGYLDKMSFAFTIADGGDEYDTVTHTRVIKNIKRLYDVAIVDIPAYDTTSINARSFFEAEAEKEYKKQAEACRKQELIKKINLRTKIMEVLK